jgi:hypothetical protein
MGLRLADGGAGGALQAISSPLADPAGYHPATRSLIVSHNAFFKGRFSGLFLSMQSPHRHAIPTVAFPNHYFLLACEEQMGASEATTRLMQSVMRAWHLPQKHLILAEKLFPRTLQIF